MPLAFQCRALYRLRRGRSRVDDFFAVLVGSILAVVFGARRTLYVQAYYASRRRARTSGAYEVSQIVWAAVPRAERRCSPTRRAKLVRELLERRWRAGIGLKRMLIAGAGDLGRMVADRMLAAPRARLSGRRLRRRSRRRRSHRLPRPAAARHARPRRPRSPRASASITSTSRCRSRSTSSCSA